MPASNQPRFSELPHDLLQRVAGLLGEEDRLAMLDVCSSWAAAIEAAPALWPTAVLSMAPTQLNEVELRKGFHEREAWDVSLDSDDVWSATEADHAAVMHLTQQAAQLSPRCRRVRLESDAMLKSAFTLAILSVLPLGVCHLELDLPCAGPLPAALLRYRQLQQLSLRTAGLDWHGRGSAFMLHRLTRLVLDYRQQPEWQGELEYFGAAAVHTLEGTLAANLSPATRLSSLELHIGGAQRLLALCQALPALRELSLDLYWCKTKQALQAVKALRQLPLLAISLSIHSYYGTETTAVPSEYPQTEFYDLTELPAMAGLHLTELRLLGTVSPPPDLFKLDQLRNIALRSLLDLVAWGQEPWSSLAALTRLEAIATDLPDPALLAAAPRLAEVNAPDSPAAWRAQLAALRPDVRITPAPGAEAAA